MSLRIAALATIICSVLFAVHSTTNPSIKPVSPDMERISTEIADPHSQYYYPKLMAKYEANETIMTLEDYRHLYLGYVFQEDYNPYRHSEFGARVEEQYYKASHTRAECDTIIKYAELSLADNPFDLRQINFLIYALREKKKNNLANIWQYRLNHILQAIVSTGTGLDRDNAWYVINPQHEYMIINLLGHIAEKQSFEAPYYDYIAVERRKETDPAGYYFNIRHILEEYLRKFPDSE
jgi:hypothetical protein